MNDSVALHGASRLLSINPGDIFFAMNNYALGFLLVGLCFGVLTLLTFLFAACCKKVNTRCITVFKVSLIFAALLQSLSTPAVAVVLWGSTCHLKYCKKLLAVWFASRRCGTLLHLLVVLEFILTSQPREGAETVPVYVSLPVVLTLDLICILFFEVLEAAVFLGTVSIILLLAIIVVACISSGIKGLDLVLRPSLVSFFAVYGPSFVAECMLLDNNYIPGHLIDTFLCVTNMRLIVDGYLCWITCRNTRPETPQVMEIR
ncbi:uncharacterized protein AKAME5_001621800 [Lates japonicus]|uniref:Uncharacterized protein n=1 Tax=Lates japonicus TaxID=270547 RepID=A0AAD3N2P2_LATJO|nr:uncharacterized protein AKAME5_001621800 [Lates japonicus]